jgi:hypothetical protein
MEYFALGVSNAKPVYTDPEEDKTQFVTAVTMNSNELWRFA